MIKSWFALRFLMLNFLLIALPLLVDTFVFMQFSYEKQISEARKELRQIADLRSLALSEVQPKKEYLLNSLIYLMKLGEEKPDPERWTEQLTAAVANIPLVVLGIFPIEPDKNGAYELIASSLPHTVGKKFSNFYEAQRIIDDGKGMFIRYLYPDGDPSDFERLHLYVFRIFYHEGKPAGNLASGTDITMVMDRILSNTYFTSLNFALLNDRNIALAASDPSFLGTYFSSISDEEKKKMAFSQDIGNIELAKEQTKIKKTGHLSFYEFDFHGERMLAYNSFIPYMNVSVMVYTPKKYFFSKAFDQYITIYIVYLTILVLGIGVVTWIGVWISRPLRQLSSLMEGVSEGELKRHFKPMPLGFEINILGGIFNTTLDSLLENMKRAEDESVKRQMYQRELDIGREVQRNLFPAKFPEIEGIELAGYYVASMQPSGDFYLMEKVDQALVLAVFDVAGQGISSSLYALSIRSILRTLSSMMSDVGALVKKMNDAVTIDTQDHRMHSTAIVSRYDYKSRVLEYVSCAHVPGFIKRGEEVIQLEGGGERLGVSMETLFSSHTFQLQEGDFVILYTDGFSNAIEVDIGKALLQARFTTAEEGVEALNRLYEESGKSEVPEDEILILVAKIR
ncbi:MAG: SpoIIE family protein phosphatase [Chlamydiales bacterium]|nr:SpoIIE family protein phosphatase [Chlamydiales bacterium]